MHRQSQQLHKRQVKRHLPEMNATYLLSVTVTWTDELLGGSNKSNQRLVSMQLFVSCMLACPKRPGDL